MKKDVKMERWRKETAAIVKKRMISLQAAGVKTSRGESMSFAAIGRTLDPPVGRVTISLVVAGRRESRRVKEAIHRELGELYWCIPRKLDRSES